MVAGIDKLDIETGADAESGSSMVVAFKILKTLPFVGVSETDVAFRLTAVLSSRIRSWPTSR